MQVVLIPASPFSRGFATELSGFVLFNFLGTCASIRGFLGIEMKQIMDLIEILAGNWHRGLFSLSFSCLRCFLRFAVSVS